MDLYSFVFFTKFRDVHKISKFGCCILSKSTFWKPRILRENDLKHGPSSSVSYGKVGPNIWN